MRPEPEERRLLHRGVQNGGGGLSDRPKGRPSLAMVIAGCCARAASGHAAAATQISDMISRRLMSASASCHRLVGLPHLQPAPEWPASPTDGPELGDIYAANAHRDRKVGDY